MSLSSASPFVPEGRIVSLNDRGEMFARIHLPERSGPAPESPALVLLHGWMVTADLNWFSTYGDLAERYRFIAPDLRGHGRGIRSSVPVSLELIADDVADLIRELDMGPIIACGYSMGGPICLFLAYRHPELVRGVVLSATALEWQTTRYERAGWHGLGLLSAALRTGLDERVGLRIIRRAAVTEPSVRAWETRLEGELRRSTPRDHIAVGRSLARYDARAFAAQLDIPAASVITTRDRVVLPAKQESLAEALDATIHRLDADHDANISCAGAHTRVVLEAIESVTSRVPAATAPTSATPTSGTATSGIGDYPPLREQPTT